MERLRVTLVAPPWQSLAHPALSVAALKSAADEHDVGIYYGYLRFAEWVLVATEGRLTPDSIDDVSHLGFDVLAGEWVFSSVLYGVGHNADAVVPRLAEAGLDSDQILELHALAPVWTEQAAAEIAETEPDVVALTTTFMGLMPALAIADRVRALRPQTRIMLGGAACDGPMGAAVHRNFDMVDFVVRGEGELPFRQLLGHLAGSSERPPGQIAGLCWRDQDGRSICNAEPHALTQPSSFGVPDHSGYFAHLATSPLAARISPVLLLESSRGCWWGQKQHCTFCGLNDLTIGYRARTGEDALGVILTAVENTQTLDIAFTDNIIDRGYYTTLLPSLAEADLDLKLFYEIKANITVEQAHALRAAGVLAVQPGIDRCIATR